MIGETTIKDIPIIPDYDNCVTIEWDDLHENLVEIQNMVGFRSFFDDLMPKKGADLGLDDKKTITAALSVTPTGHQLTMSIDLANVSKIKCSLKGLNISGNEIAIILQLTNTSPFQLSFGRTCDFVLRKDQETVGNLSGDFQIDSGEYICTLNGTIENGVSGMVTLRGSKFNDYDDSWQQYVIRLFETEINVDRKTTERTAKRRKLATHSSD